MVYRRFAYLVPLPFLARTVVAQATSTATSVSTPTYSPTLVQQNFGYTPSLPAAAIFASLYGIVTIIIFFRLFSNRTWWGLCLPIGGAVMTAGFVLRAVMLTYPNSFAIYLSSLLFILLSPAAFLAFNYILYGRFIVHSIGRRHSLIKPERTSWYFVFSDITSLLVQASGASIMSSNSQSTSKIGSYVVIGGLGFQTLSYLLFIFFVYHAFRSLKRDSIKPFAEQWGMVFKLLYFTSIFFLLRCIYRTIEFAEGLGNGYLITHEAFFYVFDSLPLIIGIGAYAVYWPGPYIYPPSDVPVDEMRTFIPAEAPYSA